MNAYQQELQALRPHDEIQTFKPVGRGYNFIGTASHGYLVVPRNDLFANVAAKICEYGYKGKLAYYLEEDGEMHEFMQAVK